MHLTASAVGRNVTCTLWIFSAAAAATAAAAAEPLFSFGVVADPQYAEAAPHGTREPREALRRLGETADQFNRWKVDFAVCLGDFIDYDDLANPARPDYARDDGQIDWTNFEALEAVWRRVESPRHRLLGNHDFNVPDRGPDGEKPGRVYRKYGFGEKAYYDFTHKGWRFLMLDGNDRFAAAYPAGSPGHQDAQALFARVPTNARNRTAWNGAISTQQLAWIERTLADAADKKQPAVLCCHYPVHHPADAHALLNAAEVLALLDRFPGAVLWLNGHDHKGGYALLNAATPHPRHHLNLPGLMDEDGRYYRIDVFSDRLEVFCGVCHAPERILKLALP